MRNGPTSSTSSTSPVPSEPVPLICSVISAAFLPPRGSPLVRVRGMTGGKLRIYLGIAPGVGKTYEMLRDARARQRSGTDTVVAYLERHGRTATAAQLDDLELLPARTVTYRGSTFAE